LYPLKIAAEAVWHLIEDGRCLLLLGVNFFCFDDYDAMCGHVSVCAVLGAFYLARSDGPEQTYSRRADLPLSRHKDVLLSEQANVG